MKKFELMLKVIYSINSTGELMSGENKNKEMLESAKRLNDKVLECEQELRKLTSMARESDNWDVKHLVLTQLGDHLLGNNSVGSIVDKVVENLESKK